MGDAEYALAFDELIMPVASAFGPDIVLVSAGFDGARGDPLGGCDITPAGYAHMTHRLLALAGGRMAVVLEGGYNLRSISRSMEAVVRVMLGEAPPPLLPVPDALHDAATNVDDDGKSDTESGGRAGSRSTAAAAVMPDANDALAAAVQSTLTSSMRTMDRIAIATGNGDRAEAAGATEGSGDDAELLASVFAVGERDVYEANERLEDCDSRAEVLAMMAPRADAVDAVAAVVSHLAPHWPVLRRKLAGYGVIVPPASAGAGAMSSSGGQGSDQSTSTSDDEGASGDAYLWAASTREADDATDSSDGSRVSSTRGALDGEPIAGPPGTATDVLAAVAGRKRRRSEGDAAPAPTTTATRRGDGDSEGDDGSADAAAGPKRARLA